jgi:hypothetical protein
MWSNFVGAANRPASRAHSAARHLIPCRVSVLTFDTGSVCPPLPYDIRKMGALVAAEMAPYLWAAGAVPFASEPHPPTDGWKSVPQRAN